MVVLSELSTKPSKALPLISVSGICWSLFCFSVNSELWLARWWGEWWQQLIAIVTVSYRVWQMLINICSLTCCCDLQVDHCFCPIIRCSMVLSLLILPIILLLQAGDIHPNPGLHNNFCHSHIIMEACRVILKNLLSVQLIISFSSVT